MNGDGVPRVSFAGQQVSRMLLGGNPFAGFGHRPSDPDFDRQLRAYFTDEKVLETMVAAWRAGINACHLRGDDNTFRWLARFRAWAATQPERPQMHWLAQTAPDRYPEGRVEGNIEAIAANHPLAIYVHGGTSDNLYAEGRAEYLRDLVGYIKGLGFAAGIGAHDPAIPRLAEERGYGADFYILSLRAIDDEPLVCRDETDTARCFRELPRQVVAIKVLAAGRLSPVEAFRYAARTLKPTDLMTVGMRDYEVEGNARLVTAALAEVSA